MPDTKKKIALLSNITADFIAAKLRKKYDFYLPEGFDTWAQETLNPDSALYAAHPDAVILLLDGTEARSWKDERAARERIGLWKQAASALAERISAAPVFLSGVDIRYNRIRALSERNLSLELAYDWYQFVRGLSETASNVYELPLADTIAETGRAQCYSDKMWYMGAMPYSKEGLTVVCREIGRALDAAFEARKKIVALDLDNTLWGGVVGEDGIEGILLSDHKEGQRYYDFQRQFLEMKKRGILLAVNSKNNEQDAEGVLRHHPAMLLRDADFVARKINWNQKDDNLRDMERELNLTESGFIMIDDNPAEREAVRSGCPEALVPEFPSDTAGLLSFAEALWFDYLRPLRVLPEDAGKTRMYQAEAARAQQLRGNLSLDDYLTKLEMVAEIHRMRPEELDRVAQLCNKTNQFNLTTRRRTRAELAELAANPAYAVYVAYVRDKYGDSGLVSVVILALGEAEIKIDTFLMSCRVMGRRLEEVLWNALAARYADKAKCIGEFIPSAKNAPVSELYDRLGFARISDEDGHRIYEFSLAGFQPKTVESYRDIRFEA